MSELSPDYPYPQHTKVHALVEPNAIYSPRDTPIRMALDRDETTACDVVGIAGFARWSPESPAGQVLFTIDGFALLSQDHTYWVHQRNLRAIQPAIQEEKDDAENQD